MVPFVAISFCCSVVFFDWELGTSVGSTEGLKEIGQAVGFAVGRTVGLELGRAELGRVELGRAELGIAVGDAVGTIDDGVRLIVGSNDIDGPTEGVIEVGDFEG